MSGDVQPRKRKDKKKRKDDDVPKATAAFLSRKLSERDDDEIKEKIVTTGVNAAKMGPDDIQLHVHSDHGTGGHWCAKVFFFSLMAILVGLIGLILLENRGLSDVDTPLSESRYADYLEGWVDEKREAHEDHHILESLHELDDHDHDTEPFVEEEDHDDDDEEDHDGAHDDHDNDEDEDHDNSHEDDEDDHDGGADHDDEDDEVQQENEQNDAQIEDEEDDDDEKDQVTEQENENNLKLDAHNDVDDDDEDEGFEEGQNQDQNNVDDDDDDDNTPFEELVVNNTETKPILFDGFHNDTNIFNKTMTKSNEIVESEQVVTIEQLESQVDDLYDVYNKLAESLNVSKISKMDAVAEDTKISENIPKTEPMKEISKRNVKEDDDDDDDDDNVPEEVIDNDEGEEEHLKKLAQEREEENTPEEVQESSRDDDEVDNVEDSILDEQLSMRRRLTIVTAEDDVPSDEENGDNLELLDGDDDEYDIDGDEYEEEEDEEDEAIIEEIEEYKEELKEKLKKGLESRTESFEKKTVAPQSFEEMASMYRPKLSEIPANLGIPVNSTNIQSEVKELIGQKKIEGNLSEPKQKEKPDETDKKAEKENTKVKEEIHLAKDEDQNAKAGKDVEYDEEEEEVVEDEELEPDDEEVGADDERGYMDDESQEDEEEDIDDEREDIDDISDDDSDLMKRLESKYGALPEKRGGRDNSGSDESDASDGKEWTKIKRTGAQSIDDDIDDELNKANAMLDDNPKSALTLFELLLQKYPKSSEILYGKGRSLDLLAEQQKSNELLNRAIDAYIKAIEFGDRLSDAVFKLIAERCIDRMRFVGQHLKAVPIHTALIKRFDNDPYYRNQLAVSYLMVNRLAEAKYVLHDTLLRWRNDGFAAVHYGFVLKNLNHDMEKAVVFLRQGIESNAEGTNDGRFYFNLGDALQRLGRQTEAMDVYRAGAAKQLFLSEYQRSLYNVDRLKSHPFWTKRETGYEKYFSILEQNWRKIRSEGLSILNEKGYFVNETENLRDSGDWKQFDLFARGRKVVKHCEKAPFTCKIIDTFAEARFCTRGQVKFSVMHPGTHVWPHCGPTNCRIRAHLGLKVPAKTFLRVATETRSWSEGKMLIFDDSFEHEVWHNGTDVRLVLIIDVWHPDLTEHERNTMHPI